MRVFHGNWNPRLTQIIPLFSSMCIDEIYKKCLASYINQIWNNGSLLIKFSNSYENGDEILYVSFSVFTN